MNEQFWVQIAVYVLTGLLAITRVGYIVGKIESRCATKDDLEKAKGEGDEKRGRIYQRLDEHKRYMDEYFVRREYCAVTHEAASRDLTALVMDMKEIWKEIRDNLKK